MRGKPNPERNAQEQDLLTQRARLTQAALKAWPKKSPIDSIKPFMNP